MRLEPGTRLGPHDIIAPLAVGGMAKRSPPMKRVLFLLPLLFAGAALAEAPAPYSNRPPARIVAGPKNVTPACAVSCPPGSIAEGEPVCNDSYVDNDNGGCNSDPPVYQNLTVGSTDITVCGTYGTYDPEGYQYRDTDWYQVILTQPAQLNCAVAGEVPTQFALLDGNGEHDGCPPITAYWDFFTAPCQPTPASATVPPGKYWIFVATQEYLGVPCGSRYTLTINAQPPPATPIGSLHCNDVDGVALGLQRQYTVLGATTGDFGSDNRYSLQDDTGGIVVLGILPPCLGDWLLVQGTLAQVNGLNVLTGISAQVFPPTPNPLGTQPAPLDITLAQLDGVFQANFCEPDESRLVRVKNVMIQSSNGTPLPTGATFAAETSYRLLASDGTTGVLRIVRPRNLCSFGNPLVGMTIPTNCPVDVTGIISQFDTTAPLSGDYELWPRIRSDIMADCPVRTVAATWGGIKAHYR